MNIKLKLAAGWDYVDRFVRFFIMKDKHVNEIKVGDIVRANKKIWRQDRWCELNAGEDATVISASKGSREGVQIVAVKLSDGNRMIDIVVENGVPLKRVISSANIAIDKTHEVYRKKK